MSRLPPAQIPRPVMSPVLGVTGPGVGYVPQVKFTWNDLPGKPGTFPPAAHSHAVSEVTGLQAALDGKQPVGSYVLTSNFNWGSLSGKPTTFTPSAHGHAIGEVTGLQAALDSKQAAGSYAAASHTHAYLPLTGGTLTGNLAIGGNTLSVGGRGAIYSDEIRTNFYAPNAGTYNFCNSDGGAVWATLTAGGLNSNVPISQGGVAVSLTGHTHAYLPLTGGSITGDLSVSGSIGAGGRYLGHRATIDMAGLDQSTYYPVTISVPVQRSATFRIENGLSSNVPSWSTHPAGFSVFIEWVANGSGWGVSPIAKRVLDWRESFTSVQIIGGISESFTDSVEIIWLRGGGVYYFSSDAQVNPVVRPTGYTAANGNNWLPQTSIVNNPLFTARGQSSVGTLIASEKVGIGTASPNTLLDVAGSITARSGTVYADAFTNYGGNLILNSVASLPISLRVNNVERMNIANNGTVTIGGSLSVGGVDVLTSLGTKISLNGNHPIYGFKQFWSGGNTSTHSSPALQAWSTGDNGAWMSFHRDGIYALNMGLDSDNVFRIGGWSAPAGLMALNMQGHVSFKGHVESGPEGFKQATYTAGARNPIWRFGNADGFGLSYFQGTAGNGGLDTIGFHFGNATATGSQFQLRADGRLILGNGVQLSDNSGTLNILTPYGSGQMGPFNSGYFHIQTDRPYFYMNRGLQVDGPLIRYNQGAMLYHASSAMGGGSITTSTAAPSGGSDGDIWLKVAS